MQVIWSWHRGQLENIGATEIESHVTVRRYRRERKCYVACCSVSQGQPSGYLYMRIKDTKGHIAILCYYDKETVEVT